jgi:hypothetical protein
MSSSSGARDHLAIQRDLLFWMLGLGTLAFYTQLLYTNGVSYQVPWIYLDEGYRLYPSLRLLRGEVLFRDMFTAYPPLSYYLHLLAYEILGVKVSSVRIVLIASQLATTLLTYALARRLMNRWFSLFAGLLTVVYGIQHHNMGFSGWYMLPPLLGAALFLTRWIESGEERRIELFAVGSLVGLAIAVKLRDGAWVAIGCAVAIIVLRTLRDFEPGRGRPRFFNPLYAAHVLLPVTVLVMLGKDLTAGRAVLFLLPNLALSLAVLGRQLYGTSEIRSHGPSLFADLAVFGAGITVITAPWVIYFLRLVGPEHLWWNLVGIPLGMKGQIDIWNIALYPLDMGLPTALVAIAAGAVTFTAAFGPARWRGSATVILGVSTLAAPIVLWTAPTMLWQDTILYVMLPLASGIALLYAGLHWRHLDTAARSVVMLGILNGAVIMSLHPSADFVHWKWTCPPALVLISFAASKLHYALAARRLPVRICVVIAQCALLFLWSLPAIDIARGTHPMERLRNTSSGDVPMDPLSAQHTQQVIDFVNQHVPAGGYVLEIPTSLYCFLTGRRQAARLDYFYVINGTLWDEQQEIETIRNHDPQYAIVRDGLGAGWREDFPQVSSYVDATYKPYLKLERLMILKKRDAPAP